MRIMITGRGILATSLIRRAPKGTEIFCAVRSTPKRGEIKMDVQNAKEISKCITSIKPDAIIHTAALTDIEYCESHRPLAEKTNAIGTSNISRFSRGAKLVYISTDSVFDGKRGWYSEKDRTNPINVYSRTKLIGERYADLAIRTNFFGFSGERETFPVRMMRLMKAGKSVSAAVDQITTPIYVDLLSDAIFKFTLLDKEGIYHVGSSKPIGTFSFAKRIAKAFSLDSSLVEKAFLGDIARNLGLKAKRPKNTSLNPKKATKISKPPSVKRSLETFKSMLKK